MIDVVLSEHVSKYLHVYKSSISYMDVHQSIGGVMVSIAAFQAVDLGSIPGQCKFLYDLTDIFMCYLGRAPHRSVVDVGGTSVACPTIYVTYKVLS